MRIERPQQADLIVVRLMVETNVYIFRYLVGDRDRVMRVAGRFVTNRRLNFSWVDAKRLATMLV